MTEEAVAPQGFFSRIWSGVKAAVCAVPRIIMFTIGIYAASSALGHFTGMDPLSADLAYNTPGAMGSKLLLSLALGTAISGAIGIFKGNECPPCQTQPPAPPVRTPQQAQAQSPQITPPMGLPNLGPQASAGHSAPGF